MNKGINRALLHGYERVLFEHSNDKGRCIFISHKSEDKPAAFAIADVLMNAGIDVFIDVNDSELQDATRNSDSWSIVNVIDRAMEVSTDILVIISENTKKSWWVPYEIGYSKRGNINITSLVLKNVEGIPEYITIEPIIHSIGELDKYIASKRKYGTLFESKANIDDERLFSFLNA